MRTLSCALSKERILRLPLIKKGDAGSWVLRCPDVRAYSLLETSISGGAPKVGLCGAGRASLAMHASGGFSTIDRVSAVSASPLPLLAACIFGRTQGQHCLQRMTSDSGLR